MNCPTCNQPVLRANRLLVDLLSNKISYGDSVLHLRPREAEIISAIWEMYPQVAPSERIISRVCGIDDDFTNNTLKQHVCHIRSKLRGMPLEIQTVWGVGYRLMMGDECTGAA